MKTFKTIMLLLARLFISSSFIAASVKSILDWPAAEQNFAAILGDWQGYVSSFPSIQKWFADGLAYSTEILLAFTALELLGGLLVFIGMKIKWGAMLLALYSFITTILFYPFWYAEVAKKEMQLTLFLQSLAILGGLIFVIIHSNSKGGGKEGEKPTKK
jgi:uncharacterized membrane protein YphA (DoxX/SURF4 family)